MYSCLMGSTFVVPPVGELNDKRPGINRGIIKDLKVPLYFVNSCVNFLPFISFFTSFNVINTGNHKGNRLTRRTRSAENTIQHFYKQLSIQTLNNLRICSFVHLFIFSYTVCK